MEETKLMKVRKFCQSYGPGERALYQMITEAKSVGKDLPFVHRVGGIIYIDPKAFLRWSRKNGKDAQLTKKEI